MSGGTTRLGLIFLVVASMPAIAAAAEGRTEPAGPSFSYDLPKPEPRFVTHIKSDRSSRVTIETHHGLAPIPAPGAPSTGDFGTMLVSTDQGTTKAEFKLGANPDKWHVDWVLSFTGIYNESHHLPWFITTAYGFRGEEWTNLFEKATEVSPTRLVANGMTWELSNRMDPITITKTEYYPASSSWEEVVPTAYHQSDGQGGYSRQDYEYKVVTSPTMTGLPIFWHEVVWHNDGTRSSVLRKWIVNGRESPIYLLQAPTDSSASVEFYTPPLGMAVDGNRDGQIMLADEDPADSPDEWRPYRLWVNDDDDSGDVANDQVLGGNSDEPGKLAGFWEMDGRTPDHAKANVDGRCDLLDFFPVYLDLKSYLSALPAATPGVVYRLRQEDSALNFVCTDLERAQAFDYLTKEQPVYGNALTQWPHLAKTTAITDKGVALDPAFLDRIAGGTNKGVILVEGTKPSDKPLVLEVVQNKKVIAEAQLYFRISEVEGMYRWVNLRGAGGQSVKRPTDTAEPGNYPDDSTNGKMFIWVHGYNVSEQQSRAWNAEAFKRLYQAGSRAMFTAVSWHGDYGQIPVAGISPDYWENITKAFKASAALPAAVDALPGYEKVIAGHSMGNMVVSSAIKDHGLNVTRYFMLNAAVALEAYDPASADIEAMRPNSWDGYDSRLWSTEWHRLFPGDGRAGLTWRDRFGDIPNAINFYSSGEDVLRNNDEKPGTVPDIGTERAWVVQEMAKGSNQFGALVTFDSQAGWGFNVGWLIAENKPGGPHGGTTTTHSLMAPADAEKLTDAQLREKPFFRPFEDDSLTTPSGGEAASDYLTRATVLGTAIPALSFATGRNAIKKFNEGDRNRDLMNYQNGWPWSRLSDEKLNNRWLHSDLKNVAYMFNYPVWKEWVTLGGLKL